MLSDIIRREIMDSISSLKFVVTFVVVILLVISGLVIGSKNYTEKIGDAQQRLSSNRDVLTAQSNWINAGYVGLFEAKQPYVLTIIDHGIDDNLGRQAEINLDIDTTLDESRNLVSPILAVFGNVDLTFVIKIVLSLFVILLTYDAISGEKELGTLKLALSNDVPRYKILLGKILGGFSVILIAFVLPMLLGLAFLMGFYPGVLGAFTGETWLRLLMIVLIYIIYLGVFFAVGLFVSSLCHRSATSFIVLLMVWVLFVTIIPKMSLVAAERLRPYESYTSLQTKAIKEIAAKRSELYKQFTDQQRLSQAMQKGEIAELITSIFEEQSAMEKEVMRKYDLQYEQQQAAQITLAEAIARSLSPTSAMSFAVENLAGSGMARQEEYLRQLRDFQQSFREYIYSEMKSIDDSNPQKFIESFLGGKELDVKTSRINFQFREESLDTVLSRSLWDIGMLVLIAIAFFAASFVAFLRYDVR
jgi:ABC-type transport system involved in multi-copper enzyme maturation permease subunit